ncbi:MAG: type II toxin-antitoxin system VapC family toxin [Candidatus Njordarchaeia archaeon]|nr:type II toxin-antitoxin system VapC family toxin [Candidatus Korarchaeota archaeon]
MLRKPQNPIFIDSNIFFYSIIRDRKYGNASAKIITHIYERKITATITSIILLEVANALRKYRVQSIEMKIKSIVSLPIKIFDVNTVTIREAIKLSEQYKISPYDATHAVICIRNGINTVISADKEFDKIKELERIDPLDFEHVFV